MNSIFPVSGLAQPTQQLVHGTLKLTLILAFILSICGCGDGYDISLYPVSGTVTLDGRKAADVFVEFQPTGADKQPRGANGYSDDEGNFELIFLKAKGCPEGTYEVRFSVTDHDEDGEPTALSQVEEVTVSSGGDNVFDFELTSDDESSPSSPRI